MGAFNVFVMYSNSVHLFSILRVKYFVTVATCGVITHFLENCVERKSERYSLASTYNNISVSFNFSKLSNGDKLEITNLYALSVSCHSLPNILKNIQTCARKKSVNSKKELG